MAVRVVVMRSWRDRRWVARVLLWVRRAWRCCWWAVWEGWRVDREVRRVGVWRIVWRSVVLFVVVQCYDSLVGLLGSAYDLSLTISGNQFSSTDGGSGKGWAWVSVSSAVSYSALVLPVGPCSSWYCRWGVGASGEEVCGVARRLVSWLLGFGGGGGGVSGLRAGRTLCGIGEA